MMRIRAFIWDEINIAKLEAHDVSADEIEWFFAFGEPHAFAHPTRPERSLALGFLPDDRFVVVVFELVDKYRVCVITAYEADHERWWKIYSKAKGLAR